MDYYNNNQQSSSKVASPTSSSPKSLKTGTSSNSFKKYESKTSSCKSNLTNDSQNQSDNFINADLNAKKRSFTSSKSDGYVTLLLLIYSLIQ